MGKEGRTGDGGGGGCHNMIHPSGNVGGLNAL